LDSRSAEKISPDKGQRFVMAGLRADCVEPHQCDVISLNAEPFENR
jgi:hypothetical protein